jgi:hypothetical protein
MCEVPGCFVRPSFKFPVRGAASQRCARHKLPGMVGNSGKLPSRDFTAKLGEISEPKSGDDEIQAATPGKRVRGELLRIQREQMMLIIDKTSTHDLAESVAKTASSPQQATSGSSIKRMKHFLANQNPNEVRQISCALRDCINAGAEGSQEQVRMNKLGVAAAPQVTPWGTPNNSASSETVHTAATTDRRVSNSSTYWGVRPSDCIFPENVNSVFSQLQGAPFSMATATPAADLTAQLAFHAATLPVNLNMPCRPLNTTDFNQTLLALNPAMWCPTVAPSYPFSAPFVPNLTPWAAAALSMSLNLDYVNNPSLFLNNPAALLTHNLCSQFAQNTAATLPAATSNTSSAHQSMAGFSAMQSQPNVAPNDVGVSSSSKLE